MLSIVKAEKQNMNAKITEFMEVYSRTSDPIVMMLSLNLKNEFNLVKLAYQASCFYDALYCIDVCKNDVKMVRKLRREAKATNSMPLPLSEIDSIALRNYLTPVSHLSLVK